MNWEFRIVPHPARRMVFGKPVIHIRDVQMLQVRDGERWVQVGYCGAEAGRPLTLLTDYGDEFRVAATAFVTQAVGAPAATLVAETSQPEEVEE